MKRGARPLRRAADWLRCHPQAMALIAGLALRSISLQGRDTWYDDTFSVFLAQRSLPEIIAGTAADTMPPLYYFLLHNWMLLSEQLWFLRLLSVLLSLVAIAFFYGLASGWVGKTAAAWAAFLAAISPMQIYYAQELRMYALLVVGQAGYLWCFTRIWRDPTPGWGDRRNWAGLVLFGLVAMYAHNLAVFGLVVPSLFLLLKRSWKLLLRLTAAQAVIGLGALPWLFYLPGQLQKIQTAFWTEPPGLVDVLQAVIMFHAAMPLPIPLLMVVTVAAVLLITMVVLETRRASKNSADLGFLLLLLAVPPLLLFAISYFMRPVFVPRGFLIAALAYYAIAGFAITQSWRRGPGKIIAAGFILLAAITLPSYYRFNTFPRSPYREAAAYLAQEDLSAAVIVHENKLSYFPMRFEDGALPQVFLPDEPGSGNDTFAPVSQQAMQIFPEPDLQAAVGSHARVYFVTYSRIFDEYAALGYASHPRLDWLGDHYRPVGHVLFNDLEIYAFEQ